MLPEYTPYLDDAMTRSLGNTEYKRDVKHQARQAALEAYKAAMRSSTYPFYSEFGLPVGKGIKEIKSAILSANPMITRTKLYKKLAKRGSLAHLAKYKMMKGGELTTEERRALAIKSHKGTKHIPGTMFHYPKYANTPEMRAMIDADPEKFTSSSYKPIKKVTEWPMTKVHKGVKHPAGAPHPKTGTGFEDKLAKYKALAKMGHPKYAQKYKAYKRLAGAGLLSARGVYARGVYARGVVPARPVGGFVGMSALATMATPIIIEGVKALGKLIKRKIKGNGEAEGVWLPTALDDGKVPKGAYSFWRQVYKIAKKQIPVFFKDKTTAKELAQRYVEEHSKHMFNEFVKSVLESKAKGPAHSPLTIGDILEPIIRNHAKEAGEKEEVAEEIINLPAMAVPAGEGIFDSIMGIVQQPEVKNMLSSAARTILPKVGKKVMSFAKGKLGKFFSKHKKIADVAKLGSEIVKPKPKITFHDVGATALNNTPLAKELDAALMQQYGKDFNASDATVETPVGRADFTKFINIMNAEGETPEKAAIKNLSDHLQHAFGSDWLKKAQDGLPLTYINEVPQINPEAISRPNEIIKAVPTAATPTTPASGETGAAPTEMALNATPYGSGAATADAYTRGGRMAARVYGMAKKMP